MRVDMSKDINKSTVLCTGLDPTGRQTGSVEDLRNVRGTYKLEITKGGRGGGGGIILGTTE